MARGCALGVFMGIMPVLPLRSALIFLVCVPLRANVIAALIVGTLVGNPFALVAWYSLALTCGNMLMTNTITWERVSGVLSGVRDAGGITERLSLVATMGWDLVFVLLAGGSIVAFPVAMTSYLVALRYFLNREGSPSGQRLQS